MISVILYGRNDDYGYNLHKRASLSLNCLAHVLSDPDDEIIFVDYNTPDDFPTFPEAIRDTLTERAQCMLRILRVRSEIHRRFQPYTHLPALEPIARNIGVRRSNASNRWILSTNTDMILVPTEHNSLSVVVSGLPSGFYHVPRYDVPESLWEGLNRMDPGDVIHAVGKLGETAHLNEIVLGAEHMLYDAPGDFQLIERDEIFAINGFCEAMLLGWHVDANIAKRLYLRHGRVGDLATRIRAYHCEHTRSFSTMHYVARSNDIDHFVDEIAAASIPLQADSWGCPEADIEEIRLSSCPSNVYLKALNNVIGEPQIEPLEVTYTPDTYNLINYDTTHILPYLTDVFVNLPRSWSVGWLAGRGETLEMFANAWRYLGFQGKIILDSEIIPSVACLNEAIETRGWTALVNEVEAFVFDFADLECVEGIEGLKGEAADRVSALLSRFFSLVSVEQRRRDVKGSVQRRVILINAINNDFEKLSGEFLATVRTPLSSRVRHGFISPLPKQSEWLSLQFPGIAGSRFEGEVHFRRGQAGHVIYGPFLTFPPGRYRATVAIRAQFTSAICPSDAPPLVMEVVSGENFFAQRDISWDALKEGSHSLDFEVTSEMAGRGASLRMELRIWTGGDLDASITAVKVETLAWSETGP